MTSRNSHTRAGIRQVETMKQKKRCWGGNDPLMTAYHDAEWGVPIHDDHMVHCFRYKQI